jgi:hypothetical protein
MNLVQINERLKDLPMQVVQQYANGMNPEVPPYLALGELQRREMSQKQMATAQGATQGAQPSVKEQVEQKAGLMALQQMQQQQMAQQMAQPRGPMPAPENVPQPEDQPEPTMMASGGLASLPVKFDFASGGIVAFQDGGKTDKYETRYDRMNRKNRGELTEKEKEELARYEALIAQIPTGGEPTVTGGERTSGSELSRNLQNTAMALPGASVTRALSGSAGANRGVVAGLAALAGQEAPAEQAAPGAAPRPAAPISRPTERMTPQQMEARMAPMGAPTSGPTAPPAPRPQAPRPAPQAPQIAPPAAPAAPAQPDPNSMDAMLRARMAQAPKARTLEDELAEQKAARAGAGMGEPAGLAQLERIRKLQEQYESSKPSGLDNLIRVFGQSSQYKGLSGLGPAHTANQQQQRAQDLAMAQKINEMMSGVETTQRGEQKEVASGALSGVSTGRTAAAARDKDLMSILSQGRTTDSTAETARKQRETQERGQDLQFKASMAQVNATLARTNMDLTQNQRVALADKAIDNVNNMIKADMRLSMQISKNPSLRDDLVRKETDRLLAVATGTKIPAAPGAASPGGTTRMKFDANGNPIK